MRYRIVLLVIAFILPGGYLAAQDSPSKFYKHRHVEKLLQAEGEDQTSLPNVPEHSLSDDEESDVEKEVLPKDIVGSTGIPILAMSAVLNADNPEHFAKHMKQLTDTVLKFDFALYKIEASGNYLEFAKSRDIRKKAGNALFIAPLLGSVPRPGKKLQEKYKVSYSPSWILHTEEGDVVLDGIQEVEQFINKKGEFIERSRGIFSVTSN